MLSWSPAVVVLALATALLSWPDVPGRQRLRLGRPVGITLDRPTAWRMVRAAPVPLAALVGAVVAGGGGCVAATALAAVGSRSWRLRRGSRRRLQRTTDLAAGVRLLVAELRAGAHPAAAAEGAAADAPPEVAQTLQEMATTARLGGDVASVLSEHGREAGDLSGPFARVARAWALAERHGVALAELLDAVRRDLEHRAAFLRDVEAKMAGPRATAAVLAGLPVLGVVLGEAAGAGPLAVLTGQLLGQVLLMIGAGLLCAGLLWTARLTEAVVGP